MKIVNQTVEAVIFDLDGVLVDTAKFHYLAWKEIANRINVNFNEIENEKLKGVSRSESLDIILSLNQLSLDEKSKTRLLKDKNDIYLKLIATLTEGDVLEGVNLLIERLKQNKIKIALGSASKNAGAILKATKIDHHFDQVVDGTMVQNSKPDPEVFKTAARLLGVEPNKCLVIEDASSGVEAALSAGMEVIGVGCNTQLARASAVVDSLAQVKIIGDKAQILSA